jgi:hypothetical protein
MDKLHVELTRFWQILDCIPDRISGWLQPAVKPVLKFKQVCGTAGASSIPYSLSLTCKIG